MLSETISPLWGRTVNPFNRNLTTGASSGGEAALVGFHGSPLGFGTDIGGSVRVPAAYVQTPCRFLTYQILWSLQPQTFAWENVNERCCGSTRGTRGGTIYPWTHGAFT
jgi:hypothetical protein